MNLSKRFTFFTGLGCATVRLFIVSLYRLITTYIRIRCTVQYGKAGGGAGGGGEGGGGEGGGEDDGKSRRLIANYMLDRTRETDAGTGPV